MKIHFKMPYQVAPASRPRVTRYGVFYAKSYESFRKLAGIWIDKQHFNKFTRETPIIARVTFNMALPKSWSDRKRKLCSGAPMISRRDIDNMQKAIMDIMQGKLFDDDCQIFHIIAEKYWAEEGSIEVVLDDKW